MHEYVQSLLLWLGLLGCSNMTTFLIFRVSISRFNTV